MCGDSGNDVELFAVPGGWHTLAVGQSAAGASAVPDTPSAHPAQPAACRQLVVLPLTLVAMCTTQPHLTLLATHQISPKLLPDPCPNPCPHPQVCTAVWWPTHTRSCGSGRTQTCTTGGLLLHARSVHLLRKPVLFLQLDSASATPPSPSPVCAWQPWTYQSPLAPLLQDCCYLAHGQLVGCRPSPAAQEPSLLQDLHGHGGRPRRHLRGPAPLQVRTCLLLPASFTLQVGCCRRRARCGVSELTPLLLLVGCPLPASACLPQLPAKRGFPPCTFNAVSESFVHAPPNACAASPTPPKPTPCTGGMQWCSAWDTWRIGAMPQCPTMPPSAAAK